MLRFSVILIQIGIYTTFTSEAARILAVFPAPSISHQVVFRPLTLELVKRGHEVVVITTDPAYPKGAGPRNLTEIDIHDVSYKLLGDLFSKKKRESKSNGLDQIKIAMNIMSTIVERVFNISEVQNILGDKTKSFDLLFIEAFITTALAFSHFYNAPVILVSSFGKFLGNVDRIMGTPAHPFLYPVESTQRINNLTTWEKMSQLYEYYKLQNILYSLEEQDNKILKKLFGDNFPSLTELMNNVDMLFLNVHPIWQGNHPVPPSVVYMGGLHQIPEKPLPQDLQSILDSSRNGVIYVSFGTNVIPSLLPLEKIRILVSVMSKLPYDVLWKWDNDELPGRTKNIRISKWFPQSDLLRHKNIKLFITQGGLQSTDEAITAGVPLIGIPMLADQWYNCEKYEKHKIGIKIELDTITENVLKNSIKIVINDESYRQNIIKLRELMLDQPQAPLERAVWWTEHVLRHGSGRHLRSPAANISWAQYLEIELVFALLLFSVMLCIMFVGLLYHLMTSINRICKVKLKKS